MRGVPESCGAEKARKLVKDNPFAVKFRMARAIAGTHMNDQDLTIIEQNGPHAASVAAGDFVLTD
jgi:hypothetical protein